MELTTEQRQKIWLVSDTVLYPEAVTMMHDLQAQEGWKPLPKSQIMGLLNIIRNASYAQVSDYIKHQIERPVHLAFYQELNQRLVRIKNKRLHEEFQLVLPQATKREEDAEKNELMLLLARELIQHLIAENSIQ